MSLKNNARLVYSTATAGTCPVCGTSDGLAAHKAVKVRKEWPPGGQR